MSALAHNNNQRTYSLYKRVIKRILDFLLAITAIVLFSPLLILLSCLVRIKLDSSVFFHQKRPGMHGKPFTLYKFRTMRDIIDENGRLLPDSDRLTRFGKFLRSMSIVGPRPLLMQYLDRYTPEQARRHEVKPGITGWAQVNGRNAISWEDKFKLDVWYVDNQSFRLDIKIIGLTIWKILKREGKEGRR